MLAQRIALRYIFSKKSHNAVGVISAISVAGVAVATAAIVIVLSVFNGFTDIASGRMAAIDPDLRIVAASGANLDPAAAQSLQALPALGTLRGEITQRGLAASGNEQMPVRFKGIDYGPDSPIQGLIIDGNYAPEGYAGLPGALVSVGVAIDLGIHPGDPLTIYAPIPGARINPAAPQAGFAQQQCIVTGVFQVDQPEYDKDLAIIPLASAQALLHTPDALTSIEASLPAGASIAEAKRLVQSIPGLEALTRMEQQQSAFRMIMVEKWVTFLMLAFILVIAAFNIVSTLSLMVIEKRANMGVMRAMGASQRLVRSVFMCTGWFITIAGGIIGIALGAALVLAQQWGGFIKLAGDASQLSITVYPVRLLASDVLAVLALVALVALCASAVTTAFAREKSPALQLSAI